MAITTFTFWERIFETVKWYPFKSAGLAILIAFAGACLLALGQL